MLSQQTRRAGKRAPRRLEARVEARSRASNGQAWDNISVFEIGETGVKTLERKLKSYFD